MKAAVVLMGLMLVFATVVGSSAFAQDLRKPSVVKKTPTVLELEMTGCRNTTTCNAEVFVGDVIEFNGTLTTGDGEPIQNAPVTIYKFIPKPELVPIASGVTGIEGDIQLSWTARFTPTERVPTDVTQKFQTETVTILAQFDGTETFESSRSSKNTAVIRVNELSTFVNSDQNLYRQGEAALIFINFIDINDNFLDPDSLRVVLNEREVEVEKKAVGSYTLTIPALPKEHTQLFVLPKKEGFNVENGFLTLIVDGLK